MNQENAKDDNPENKKEKEENGDFKFVYFIDTHEKTKKFKIYLPDDYEGKDSLENITEKDTENELGGNTSEVYRFKIIPGSLQKDEEQKYQILILGEGEDGKNYQYSIIFPDESKDFFEYDFNIEKTDFQPLSHEKQFEIYVEILRKKLNKKVTSPENNNLIISTHRLLDEKEKKYNFFFYLLIFMECYKTKSIQQHLFCFKPEKIEGLGTFPESKIKLMKTILNLISKNPSKTLNLQNLKDEIELNELFYSILLYFNMNFQKEKVEEMFKDEKILTYLSKKLISFHSLYQGLILPKDTIRNLIKKSKTSEEILGFLPYIGTNIIEFLQLIYSELEFIKSIYDNELDKLNEENENKEKKDRKEIQKIELEKYVIPQKEDNIEKLYEVASLIFISLKMSNMDLIKFSKSLIGKYIEFYYGKSLKKLQLLTNLINLIKKNDKKFEFKYEDKDIDLIIHETGIELIKNKKMKNTEILDFISSDIYFNSEKFEKAYYRPLEILDGIDIEALDDKFFSIWEKINFNNIFIKWMNAFYDKIALLIGNMKDFGLLYKFFLFNNEKAYKSDTLKIMKKKYIELLPTYKPEICSKFIEETIKIISLLDEKKLDTKELLESIQNNLDFEKVNEIYIKLSDENKNLRDKTKDVMVGYFTTNKNNSNPSSLIYLIKNCKNLRKEIFSKINKYNLTEFDFLILDETENFKLYKGLIDNKIIDKEFEYKGATYLTKVQTVLSSLEEKIKNFEIKYSEISIFFQNEENKKILKEKLLYLDILDEIKQQKQYAQLEYKVNEVKNKIYEFELIYSDFRDFFYEKNKVDLDKLTNITSELKVKSLNYLEKNFSKEYKYYSKFLEDAKRRNNLKKSAFFNEILKHNQKNVFKNNEVKALEETENAFDKLKVIFKDGGITKVDENILEICIKPFRENEEQLKNEIKILSDLFKFKGNLDNIYEGILLFSKRGFIFDAAAAIKVFIEKINPKQTNFTKSIKEIISIMKENNEIETIKKCNEKLKELNLFDGNERQNKLFNILFKFKEQPDSLEFILKTSLEEAGNLQEIASLNENNFVNVNDILDMEKCIEFFNNIGKYEELEKMEDIKIIEKMQKNVKEQKDIYVYFEKYVNNYGQISLLKSTVDMSESLKYKIKSLFEGSTFLLSNERKENENSKELLFECKYEEEVKKEMKKITLKKEDIITLRDKALLSKVITDDYQYFIDSTTEIINISNLLEEIYIRGYPKIIKIKIYYKVEIIKKAKDEKGEIKQNIDFFIDDQKKNSFKEIITELKNILNEIKEKQINYYKKMPLIRYLYGRQFNLLYDALEMEKSNQIKHLLKYITNDLNKDVITKFTLRKEGDLIENNIQDWNDYLKEVFKRNKLTLEKIYQPSLIKPQKINRKIGICTYVCDQPEKNLFQIYKYITDNNPIAQNILLCNKMTSNQEITAFLYRAVLCEYNSCFIITGLESLETEKKSTILEFLNNCNDNNYFPKEKEEEKDKKKDKMKSCLIFLFSSKNSDIYKSFETKNYRQILDVNEAKFGEIKYEKNDIEIIKSDRSGVGKSTKIKLDIEKMKKRRIYFPFGGAFSQEDIISRLKNLQIDNNCVLHLDLYDSDQTNLMMEFLFSILITRFYGQNDDIFFLSKEIPIKVEIPNTFINFFEKFSILNLFPVNLISIKNLAPLIVPKNISCNIEVVANYLQALKEDKINGFDFIFKDITPVDFEKRIITDQRVKWNSKTTSLKPTLYSAEACQKLIFEIIKDKIKEPNYYQIISFINVLAVQLKKLNRNHFLNAFDLICNFKWNILYIRTFIVKNFIDLTSHFTEGAYTDILQSQEKVSQSRFGLYDEKKDLNSAINNLAKDVKDVISFDKIDPSLVFFHEKNGELFSIITNKQKDDKEYQQMLQLKNSQFDYKQTGFKELPNYKKYKQLDFLQELQNILDVTTPVEKVPNSAKISLEEIAGDYVLTADNFVKMMLILLRIRSGIPVIMMGETGCGKTSLIRKLSEMKNDGDKQRMKILNIHAGTNDNDIIKFINENVIPDARKMYEGELKLKERYSKEGQIFEYTKLWVFLDEINTCKSMGLISELMCKHTCQGSPLPENIVFIAACNPYRIREKKSIVKKEKIGLDVNQAHEQMKDLNEREKENIKASTDNDLVYTVHPLPHSLLNFVFYFGALKPEDEQKYIKCIISSVIEKIYYKKKTPEGIKEENEDDKIKKLKKLSCDMIWEAQQYIREKNDKSAVSLREIRRVNIFFEFFYNYLKSKKEFYLKGNQNELNEEDSEFYIKLDDYTMQIYAINLSIFMCYYLRITDKEQRKELNKKMNDIFNQFNDNFKSKDFLDLPIKEEKFIVNNIKLDKGIAKNRALLENIFSLYVAINSKVPIFIVGKPGCSKSLSVQLITKSMQGSASDKPFFKTLPKTIIHSYQGSLSSTSKGVENVFIKARETLKLLSKEDKKKNISLIFFDEMGLAEHSPNNPLKVIHSELEYDQNEDDKQVAFVGISNWNLDAAKMNRGISISIPEPDEEDNKETSFTIGNSYDENMSLRYKSFFENLGISYYNYKQYLKDNYSIDGKDDFHGNRDFYHLVKNSARNMLDKEKNNALNDQSLLESAIDSIERNFSGIQFDEKPSVEIFKGIFQKIYPNCPVKKEYDVLKRIKENINDLNSRYLLVASESSIGTFLLSSILDDEKKEYSFYVGSPFKQDLHSEEYALKVLNKIQSHMERGNILILKNLETVYPSMYDLFNQNFTVIGGKNYSRLAVGSNTNTFAYVNKNFRCIVNVEASKIDKEEAPFLNRFEKHIMSFEYLMDEELIREADKIKSNIDGFFKCNTNMFKAINYDLKKLMINCSKEEIQALVYNAYKNGIKKEDVNDYVLEKISMTLPQDILVNLKITGPKQTNNLNKILKFYCKGEHSNFSQFLEKAKCTKNIIYTFTGYLEEVLEEKKIIKNSLVGEIKKENIKTILLNSIKSEREFETYIDDYLREEKLKVCIIKFLPNEGSSMNYIKYFIENKIGDNKDFEKKIFIFIVHMSRIFIKDLNEMDKMALKDKEEFEQKILSETLSNLSGFYQIFIDNLSGESSYKIDKIINMKRTELFKTLINPDEELASNIYTSISYMQYNITAPYKGLSNETYVDKLMSFICKKKRLRDLMNKTIFNQSFTANTDIITKVFKEKDLFNGEEIEIISIIKKYLSIIYTKQLSNMFFKAEKDQFFSSLLSNELEKEIWPNKDDKNKEQEDKEEEINLKKEQIYEDKTIIEKIAKKYLETMVYNDGKTNIVEKIGSNKVNIIFGLKIPGIKPVLEKIVASARENTLKNYRNNENELRNYIETEEEVEEAKKTYFENLIILNNSLFNLINKEESLKNISSVIQNNDEEEKELYNLLINDYYSFFIINNINKAINKKENNEEDRDNFILLIDNFDNNIKYLKLMFEKRKKLIKNLLGEKNIPNNNLHLLATMINWIESYSEEITILQQIFLKLNMKIPELYEQIEKIINSEQIKYEISERNPEYFSIVNKIFFLSLDSILRIITSKAEIYELPLDDFFDLINTNKEVLQNAMQLEAILKLRSKEVFSLQEILKLIDALYSNNLANVVNVKKVIQYFKEETICLQMDTKDKLCSNLDNFYKTLENIMGNIHHKKKDFDFYKLLSLILLDEFNKIQYTKFRETILDKILKKDDLIKNCSQIIKIIIENGGVDCDPEYMDSNIDNIKTSDSEMLRRLNNEKNLFLEEVIMNIFERKIAKYFELIPFLEEKEMKNSYQIYYDQNKKEKNKTGIIFNKSFQIFEDAIKNLDLISKSNNQKKNQENTNLLKLYCVVYVKMYLYYFTYFIDKNYQKMKSTKSIIDCIENISNKNFAKVIKIYTLKLIYNLKNCNFEEFQNYEFEEKGIKFYKEIEGQKNSGDMLTYFFMPSSSKEFELYDEILGAYIKNSNFSIDNKDLENYLEKYGLDLFLILILNKVISNLPLTKNQAMDSYKNFCNYAKTIFTNNKNIHYVKELWALLSLFFDSYTYNSKTKDKISVEKDKIDIQIFEILLYGFRFCANSLYFKKNEKIDIKKLLFPSILTKDCKKIIDNSLIPGIDDKEDLHVFNLESIQFHLNNFPDSCGCYVCSCGIYYNIDPCGFPTSRRTFKCQGCGKDCGWGPKVIKDKGASNHGMIIREGHYRIFKDKAQKVSQMSRWNDPDENIPNKLYEEYSKEVYEKYGKNSAFGFNSVDRDYFEKQDKKIRKLSSIGYRLLNFISYSHLFFSYCLENIKNDELNQYLIRTCNILKIIQIDWDFLKEDLQKKNIGSIQIFLNLIFTDLSKLIKTFQITKKDLEREAFENKVEALISQNIKKYLEYSEAYNKQNQKLSDSGINSLKTFVTEVVHPSSNSYNENEYPMFKYFNYTKYKSEEDMIKKMNNKENYPLIRQLVNDSPEVRKLASLPAFNEFTNYMTNYYSFKISREEAKKRALDDEKISKELGFNKKYNNFIKAWDQIKSKATKYKCRPVMEVKEKFSKKDKLITFLNDAGELYNGMYLAAACQNFIEWQNTFLQPIVDANIFNGILHNYVNTIIKKIPIQEAKPDQIVLIKERFNKSGKYVDFNDVIYAFSERNIYGEKGKINYSDYNTFVYDYDRMEEELGKIILPGVCLFEGEDNLNFVTYWGEGFRGGNSSMISKFYLKYTQIDLNMDEKKDIKNYIDKMNKMISAKSKKKKRYDFKNFFGSLQILLFYLTEKGVMNEEEKIVDVITNAPAYLKLSDDCKNFFNKEGKEYNLKKIMNLFFFFEHLCFEDLAETLQPEYKAQIPEDIKVKIINVFMKQKKDDDKIPVKYFGASTRRLISRYLAGKLQVTDIKEDRDLAGELTRTELWEERYSKLEDLEDIIYGKMKDFKLTVGQAYEFYNIIGQDDRKTIELTN